MINRWEDATAQRCTGPLSLRAYTSRLIGGARCLVLYGGGNTSLKLNDVLHVKSTGTDLANVNEDHFTALDLKALLSLLQDEQLSDSDLMRRMDECKLESNAPKPSIETYMHAVLPGTHIEHAHADAVLAVANVAEGAAACSAAFGDLAPVVPYHHSGSGLARACKTVFDRHASRRTIGLILAFHGVVAFGHTARESYGNLLRLVTLAEDYLRTHNKQAPRTPPAITAQSVPAVPADLHAAASKAAGYPLAMKIICTADTLAFASRRDIAEISQQGPPTPQHAIYTKRVPLLGSNVEAYAAAYRAYLAQNLGANATSHIDAAPRIALSPDFGLCAFGVNEHYAAVAAEIYLHDIDIITRASSHGAYRAASEQDIARAELEYGGFEQRVRTSMASAFSP